MFLKTLYNFSLPSLLISLCLGLALSSSVSAGQLKPTMKEMRLHYKQAVDTQDPAIFNERIAQFLTELQTARAFKFSPERKELSLEGLDKVEALVSGLPAATDSNLPQLQKQLKEVDQLRIEYHKKVKPGAFELLLNTLKEAIGL